MNGLFKKISRLYAEMQTAYDALALRYGFTCSGCTDNCCDSVFHHHTIAEYQYMAEGLRNIDPALRNEIFARAAEAEEFFKSNEGLSVSRGPMCPVNINGLCALYKWRPMICRLHGLPYSLRRPDGVAAGGEGCGRFQILYPSATQTLDRTRFYTAMAEIEKGFRARLKVFGKVSMTNAGMIVKIKKDLGL